MIALQRRSALAHREPLATPGGEAALRERPFEGKLIFRGSPEVIGGSLGVALPQANGTAIGLLGVVQWLSADEWLLVTPPSAEAAALATVGGALAGKHVQAVDVTDYYTTIAVSGSRAREMLMKIATVDFHPRAFKPGMGVTTNFGRTIAWGRQTAPDSFDLIVRISMSDYLWCLLAEAGREWGLPAQIPKGGDVKLHLQHFETETNSDATPMASDLEIA